LLYFVSVGGKRREGNRGGGTGYGGLAYAPFCGGHGDYFFDVLDVAFRGEAALETWDGAGFGEALDV
jgi:hypothetical protein